MNSMDAMDAMNDYASALPLYASGSYAQALDRLAPLLQAGHPDALNLGAVCLRRLNRPQEAEALLRRLIDAVPGHADAHCNLGNLLKDQNRPIEAEAAYQRALALRPDHAESLHSLGCLQHESQRLAQAEASLRRLLAIHPGHPDAQARLGLVLHDQGQFEQAAAAHEQALALRPDHAFTHYNLGNTLLRLRRMPQAEAAYLRTLELLPGYANAHFNLGVLYQATGRIPEAEAAYRRSIALHPGSADALHNLGSILIDAGLLDEGLAFCRQATECDPTHAASHSALAYALAFQAETGQVLLDECRRWSARHEAPLRAARQPHANDRSPGRRLRIGYVSPDFRNHCQALFTVPVFSHHDHAAFEFFFYSSAATPDILTQRLRGHADTWRDVHALDDEQLAQTIRGDGIDILVDLTLHMSNGRPLLFARKPAPVQVAWLAYPGTTGIAAMDYRLTDPHLDPLGTDALYTERSIRLPDAFWCYDPLAREPAVNELPARTAGHISFGSLNNPAKLTDRTLRMWAAVLDRLPGARLQLLAPRGQPADRLLQRIEAQGIATQRVRFAPFQPRGDYLSVYHGIDIGLDTFPCNGHTTSLDAAWMGVPVVSRVGDTAVGRGGLSLLMNLGLGELAARTDEEFIDIAVRLASDLPRLAALRQSLRHRLEQSPLMDGARFARNIEAAYRQMWHAWCASAPKRPGESA